MKSIIQVIKDKFFNRPKENADNIDELAAPVVETLRDALNAGDIIKVRKTFDLLSADAASVVMNKLDHVERRMVINALS